MTDQKFACWANLQIYMCLCSRKIYVYAREKLSKCHGFRPPGGQKSGAGYSKQSSLHQIMNLAINLRIHIEFPRPRASNKFKHVHQNHQVMLPVSIVAQHMSPSKLKALFEFLGKYFSTIS